MTSSSHATTVYGEEVLASIRYEMQYHALREGIERLEADRLRDSLRRGQLAVPKKLPSLSQFAEGCTAQGSWRAALRDPASAAAMRGLRRRVAELNDPLTAVVPSAWAYKEMNGQAGALKAPTRQQHQTSPKNPFSFDAELLPAARLRELRGALDPPARHAPRKKREPTSLWCSSWEMSAS